MGWDPAPTAGDAKLETDRLKSYARLFTKAYSFLQNGHNCGPISISILLALMYTGCLYGRTHCLVKPRIGCAHAIRLQVLEVIIDGLPEVWRKYLRHQTTLGHVELVTDTMRDIFDQGIERYYHVSAIARGLEDKRHHCSACRKGPENASGPQLHGWTGDEAQSEGEEERDGPDEGESNPKPNAWAAEGNEDGTDD